ncbi:YppG family protein [Virgibacillus sp. FSP13]
MFPGGPRRPMPRNPLLPPPRQMQRKQAPNRQNLIAMFQTADGNLDIEKISSTARQINDVYKQVSPMVAKFIKK